MSADISYIEYKISDYKNRGLKIFATSSFQTQSVVLMHILSRIDRSIPVFFLNTGYLFPETLDYRDQIKKMFGLTVIDLVSPVPKSMQKDDRGNLLFTSDPDHCCQLNKTEPMESVLSEYDVWISGVRAEQSDARRMMREEEAAPKNVLRFHPLIKWRIADIYEYIREYRLPKHPLEELGYASIGCEPCTRKPGPDGNERSGRWFGLKKTECGLHTELVKK
ncbi:MAG: phosphoadenylyl-sulfate reductase [Bacteroidetes bacterium]|nr:phosphoadenylyl-sulfate reductase [Bacteroidota bacterium]